MRSFLKPFVNFQALIHCNRFRQSYIGDSDLLKAQDKKKIKKTRAKVSQKQKEESLAIHQVDNKQRINSIYGFQELEQEDEEYSFKSFASNDTFEYSKKAKQVEDGKPTLNANKFEFENIKASTQQIKDKNQYPALNFLNQAFNSRITEPTSGFNVYKSMSMSVEERNQNSLQFMKIVSHSMPKESSSKIIQMIEKHCNSAREQQGLLSKPSGEVFQERNGSKSKKDKKEQKLIENIKKNLEKQLNDQDHQAKKNAAFIKKLVASFKKTNPFRITMKAFEQNYSSQQPRHEPEVSTNQIFKQSEAEPNLIKQAESQTYGYVYDLPYDLTQQDSAEFIAYLQNAQDIKVQSFAIFPYKDLFQNKPRDIIFSVPNDYKDQGRIQKAYNTVKIQAYLSKNKKKDKKANMQIDFEDDETEFQLPSSNAEVILSRMKTENFLKYNKSSMIIKFRSKEDKLKIVTMATRLFGLTFKHLEKIKFQEASRKNIITLSGIQVGCNSTKLIEALNVVLGPEGIPLELEEESYLSKHYVNISFKYFTDSLRALTLLNNLEFEGKKLKTQIKYGPTKLHKQDAVKSQENIELVRKIMDIREQYLMKYAFEDEKIKF